MTGCLVVCWEFRKTDRTKPRHLPFCPFSYHTAPVSSPRLRFWLNKTLHKNNDTGIPCSTLLAPSLSFMDHVSLAGCTGNQNNSSSALCT